MAEKRKVLRSYFNDLRGISYTDYETNTWETKGNRTAKKKER